MKVLQIRILKSSGSYYWYANLIGVILFVYDNKRDYILKEDYDRGMNAPWRHIDKEDAEIVETFITGD